MHFWNNNVYETRYFVNEPTISYYRTPIRIDGPRTVMHDPESLVTVSVNRYSNNKKPVTVYYT
jgi:hypothetical protein